MRLKTKRLLDRAELQNPAKVLIIDVCFPPTCVANVWGANSRIKRKGVVGFLNSDVYAQISPLSKPLSFR
jgi:hypothetical protein